jgi:hypothetical protein
MDATTPNSTWTSWLAGMWSTPVANNQALNNADQVQKNDNQVPPAQEDSVVKSWDEEAVKVVGPSIKELLESVKVHIRDKSIFQDIEVLEKLGLSPRNKLSVQVTKTAEGTSQKLVISETEISTYIGSNLQALDRSISQLKVFTSSHADGVPVIHADGELVLKRVNEVMEAFLPWNLNVEGLNDDKCMKLFKNCKEILEYVKIGMLTLNKQYTAKYSTQEKATSSVYNIAKVFYERAIQVEKMKSLNENLDLKTLPSLDYDGKWNLFKTSEDNQCAILENLSKLDESINVLCLANTTLSSVSKSFAQQNNVWKLRQGAEGRLANLLGSLGNEVIDFFIAGNTKLAELGMNEIEKYEGKYGVERIRGYYNHVKGMNDRKQRMCDCEQAIRKILPAMDHETRLMQIDALERDFGEPIDLMMRNGELAQDEDLFSEFEQNLRQQMLDAYKNAKTIVRDELRGKFVGWANDALKQGQIDQAAAYFVKRICFGHDDESNESLKQDFEIIIRTMKDKGQLDSFCKKLLEQLDSFCEKLLERAGKYNETADSEKIAKGIINISGIMKMVANVKSYDKFC